MHIQVHTKMNYSQVHNNKYTARCTVHTEVVGKVHVKVHTNEPVLALECRDHLEGGHLLCGFLDININTNINIDINININIDITCVLIPKYQHKQIIVNICLNSINICYYS